MVSTPIGANYLPEPSQKPVTVTPMPQIPSNLPVIPNSTSPIMQPTLQTGMPYMPNFFSQASTGQHTFPVLYNSPVPATAVPTEVQPVSLYAEYMGNPYNVPSPDVYNLGGKNEVSVENPPAAKANVECESNAATAASSVSVTNINLDLNKNNNHPSGAVVKSNYTTNFFQSSNYFGNSTAASCIPAGSEILFGVEQCNVSGIQGINIPITTESKTTTDVWSAAGTESFQLAFTREPCKLNLTV